MPDSIFQRVVLPVYGNENNSVLMITTLDGDQNWVSSLSELKRADGKPMFHVIRHGPCQACTDEGIGDKCPHFERAPWKSKSKDDDVRAIYKQQGKMDLFAQEMRGETIGRSFLLAKKNVIALRQRPLFVWARPPGVIHLGIDPHGGGKTSETAIMAISYTRGHIVICGADVCGSHRDMEIFGLIKGFVERLRAIPDYHNSKIIIHAEANDWTKADRYCRELMEPEYGPGEVVPNSQDNQNLGRFGVYTNALEKDKFADHIERAFLGEEICYARDFCSLAPKEIQAKFEDQAIFYRKEIREGADPIFQEPRYRYTGKGQGGRCDDLITIFGLVDRWAYHLRRDRGTWAKWAADRGVSI